MRADNETATLLSLGVSEQRRRRIERQTADDRERLALLKADAAVILGRERPSAEPRI